MKAFKATILFILFSKKILELKGNKKRFFVILN